MMNDEVTAKASGRAPLGLGALAEDWRRLGRQLRVGLGGGGTKAGLYAYPFGRGAERVILHLRVQADGSGVLFLNVAVGSYVP